MVDIDEFTLSTSSSSCNDKPCARREKANVGSRKEGDENASLSSSSSSSDSSKEGSDGSRDEESSMSSSSSSDSSSIVQVVPNPNAAKQQDDGDGGRLLTPRRELEHDPTTTTTSSGDTNQVPFTINVQSDAATTKPIDTREDAGNDLVTNKKQQRPYNPYQRTRPDPSKTKDVPSRCARDSSLLSHESKTFSPNKDSLPSTDDTASAHNQNTTASAFFSIGRDDSLGKDTTNATPRDQELEASPRPKEPTSDAGADSIKDSTVTSNEKIPDPGKATPLFDSSGIVTSRRVPPEVDPQVYLQRSPQEPLRNPILCQLTVQTRPLNTRQKIPVGQVFEKPLCDIWKSKFQSFNCLQSELASKVANSDDNIVLSAPTGAGKTAVFEMAMARLFGMDLQQNNHTSKQVVTKRKKIVYMAPSKALCEERFQDWSDRLAALNLGIDCAMITGDNNDDGMSSYSSMAEAQLILTTPEKWDSLSRKWTQHFYLFASVKLLLLDEVHLLGDGTRGCCLESVVCRIKTIQRTIRAQDAQNDDIRTSSYTNTTPEALSSPMRIVAVSATLPNLSDIASFLEASECYSFDSSYRPVPLTVHVAGLGFMGGNQFMFGKSLNRHVPTFIERYSKRRPTIVFCHSKKETEALAVELSSTKTNARGVPHEVAGGTKVVALQRCLLRGFAYHHAGLDAPDRKLVEKAFADGNISCLCATSTLAMGVNLPAHLVIIKGTSAWRGGGQGHQDIDPGQLLQMIGRAGRPGFDTSGTAVIMTDNASRRRYEQLSSGLQTVESQLPKKLVEVLNSEISQQVVTTLANAMDWIKGTFFYCRAKVNPSHYGMCVSSRVELDSQLEGLISQSLRTLTQEGIVSTENDSTKVSPLHACHVMSQHMVAFDAMKKIVRLPYDAGQLQLLETLSDIEGLQRPVRRSEKKELNEAHKVIKYQLEGPPSKVRIQTPSQKAFVLLQAAIGQHNLEDYTLRQEMSSMVEYAKRMLTAAEEFSIEGSKHGYVAYQSLLLRRSLATSLWGATRRDGLVLNQLRGVGVTTAARLRFNNIISFQDVMKSSAQDIEKAAARSEGFGQDLLDIVTKILQRTLKVSAKIEYDSDLKPSEIVCIFAKSSSEESSVEDVNSGRIVSYTLSVHTDRPGGCIMFLSNIADVGEYRFPCPPNFGRVYVHAVSNLVGLDENLQIDGKDPIAESRFTLSPSRATESKKPRGSTQKAGARKTKQSDPNVSKQPDPYFAFRNSVIGMSDVRLKSKVAASNLKSQSTGSRKPNATSSVKRKSSLAVTPSPPPPVTARHHVPVPQQRGNKPLLPHQYRSHTRSSGNNRRSPIRTSISPAGPGAYRTNQSSTPPPSTSKSWKRAKTEQRKFQDRAFHYEKENPFAMFKYDPNDIESNLEQSSTKGAQERVQDDSSSIIPPGTLEALRQSGALQQNQQFPNSAASTRTLGKKRFANHTLNGGRRTRRAVSNQMPPQTLLQMKAEEWQAHETRSVLGNRPFMNPRVPPPFAHSATTMYSNTPTATQRPSIFPQHNPFHDNSYIHGHVEGSFDAVQYEYPYAFNEASQMAGQHLTDWNLQDQSFQRTIERPGSFQGGRGAGTPYEYRHGRMMHPGGNLTHDPVHHVDDEWDSVEAQVESLDGSRGGTQPTHLFVATALPFPTAPTTNSSYQPHGEERGPVSHFISEHAANNEQRDVSNADDEEAKLLEEAFFLG